MQNTGASEPRKGTGYFAKRLKEKGITAESARTEVEAKSEESEVTKAGQIFEESTKSIATMTDDVSETAKLVSSMKEGLERVTKIADMFSNNPLCDSAGSCSFDGIGFSPDSYGGTLAGGGSKFDELHLPSRAYESGVDDAVSASNGEITELAAEVDDIRSNLQQVRQAVSSKGSDLLEFREKLNQARAHIRGMGSQEFPGIAESADTDVQTSQKETRDVSEFDSITSSDYRAGLESAMGGRSESPEIQEREQEGKLFNLRWKIKKAEAEYEKKKALADSLEDLTGQVEEMESKRDQMQSQIARIEEEQKQAKSTLKEIERRIEHARKESEERLAGGKQVEDAKAVLEYLKLDKEGLKVELEQLRSKVREAEKHLEEKKAAHEAMEDVRLAVSMLKAEKTALGIELEQLRNSVRKADAEMEERKAEKEKVGESRAVLAHLRIEKESLESEISDLKSKIRKAESEYQQKKQAAEELYEVREILAYLKPEREQLRAELAQIRSSVEKLEMHYDEIRTKKLQIQSECDELELKVMRLKSAHDGRRPARIG